MQLDDWLKVNDIHKRAFAASLKMPYWTLVQYMRPGKTGSNPSALRMLEIRVATDGAVDLDDWVRLHSGYRVFQRNSLKGSA